MQIPEGPDVTILIVNTNDLFLPFVSSLFPIHMSMAGISFYSFSTLAMSVSLFLLPFRDFGESL